MFITDGDSNYDRVCEELLAVAKRTGAAAHAPLLGGRIEDGAALLPLFGQECAIRSDGVYRDGRRLDTIGSILLLRYLLQAGCGDQLRTWVPYRDLKDGAQFSSYIKVHIEDKVAEAFAGKREVLRERLAALGALPSEGDLRGDLVLRLSPLPHLPVLCLFWDKDEEFPASFQFFFDGSAPSYLDLESLAVVLQYISMKLAEGSP